jgi:magnesium-transporting ATPase (P-type)
MTCPCPGTVHLCAGDLVPADGAIFQKSDIAISEKMLTGETTLKHKGMYKFTGQEMPDEPVSVSPAVFAGTMVEVTSSSPSPNYFFPPVFVLKWRRGMQDSLSVARRYVKCVIAARRYEICIF